MELGNKVKHQRFFPITAIVLMLFLLSACATTTQQAAPQAPAPPARLTGHVVSIKQNLPVRADASLKSKELGKLFLGDPVYVNEEKTVGKDDWYHIASMDEKAGQPVAGWVLSQYIEKDPPPPPPEQSAQEGSKDINKMKWITTLQGVAVGAAVGAATGAIASAASGHDPLTGALIGGGIGAVGGLVAGVYVANQKEKYATEEAYLDACIKEAEQYNEEARKTNEYLRGYIADTQLRIKDLRAQIKKDKAKKQLAADEISKMSEKKQALDKMITNLEGEAKAQDGALTKVKATSPQSTALQQEVQTTRQELDKLRQQREELVKLTTQMNDLAV